MLGPHLHQHQRAQGQQEENGGEQDDELDRDLQLTLTTLSSGGGDDRDDATLAQELAQLRIDASTTSKTCADVMQTSDNNNRNNIINTTSGSGGSHSPLKHAASTIGVLELLHEELKLEIAPRKLLRQFSLNIPPSATRIGGGGCDTPSDFRSAILSRNFIQHGSPNALGDVLERWEVNHVKWRRHGSSQSLAAMENQHGDSADQTQLNGGADQAMLTPLQVAVTTNNNAAMQQQQQQGFGAGASTLATEFDRLLPLRSETFEVKFGHGFLGIEFVIDETRNEVVVKSVQAGTWSASTLQIPPYATISRGLIVDAINGREVGVVAPEEILDLLQYTARPLTVRFRKCGYSAVVCKLCECKVEATNLDEHTNYCVMSKRFELEADQINNALTKLAASIKANLEAATLRTYFHSEDLHFYNALRVAAIQVRDLCVAQQQPMITSEASCCKHSQQLVCLFVCRRRRVT